MCGQFYVKLLRYLEEYDQLQQSDWPQDFSSYNIAPTQNVPVVRMVDGQRAGSMLRWGLVPFWARGEPPKYSTINATIEKIESAATWRGPWQLGQRCILMASGFYEWHLNADGSKQPFAIEIADQPMFGFAGLWDRSRSDAGEVVESADSHYAAGERSHGGNPQCETADARDLTQRRSRRVADGRRG